MFIHGGYDENNNVLNCFFVLNFNPLKWHDVLVSEDRKTKVTSPFLAYHTCCLVLPTEIKMHSKLNIYRIPDLHKNLLDNTNDVRLNCNSCIYYR